MTDLRQSLIKADFSHLKAVAEVWELSPFTPPDAKTGLEVLAESLLDTGFLSLIPGLLTDEDKKALLWLEARGGKEYWDRFIREYGEIREMGAGKLEREKPYLKPITITESLWYRALIGRGFLETDAGSREFAFIPEDLRQALMPYIEDQEGKSTPVGFISRQASAREYKFQSSAGALVLDQLCTYLAAKRMDLDPSDQLPGVSEDQMAYYQKLCQYSGMLDEDSTVDPEDVRVFFELSRQEAFLLLWKNWRSYESFHDLLLVPGLMVEGDPEIPSLRLREQILDYLSSLDPGEWWSIESFISRIKEINPDLLRKSGEFEAWFIKKEDAEDYLKGFQYWNQVEGALLRFILTGPLFWLGFLDLGYPEEDGDALAFRLSDLSEALLNESPVPIQLRKPESIQIRSKGEIRMTDNVPHKTRYQVARFCDWFPVKADAYVYTITPASLSRAEEQGLRVAHLLSLLKKNLEEIPPNILAALERWDKKGAQASIAERTILRLGSPQILKALKKSKASRYILEQLGPTAVIVKDGSEEKIAEALVELGFFLEIGD